MGNFFEDLFENYILWATIAAWFVAQFIKMIITLIKEKKFKPTLMLFSCGGMPSSHTSTVSALFTSSAIVHGLGSFEFAVSFIFAMVVVTDALGVRREAGKHAKILNKIMEELFSGNSTRSERALKELVGHTPFQVAMGALVGICTAVIIGFIIGKLPL